MRLLHEVHPDEQMICRGQYQYLRGGEPTGQLETWQMTRLPDGDEIVRADIHGGESVNLLTHYHRGADGRPAWLRMRYERGDFASAAQYTFEDAVVEVIRQAEGHYRRQQRIDVASGYEVDYHSVIAHDYVWRGYPRHARGRPWAMPVVSPELWTGGDDVLDGRVLRFNVTPRDNEDCEIPAGRFEDVRHYEVILSDGVQALGWFDDAGIPLRWYYPEKNYDFILTAYTRLDEANTGLDPERNEQR